MTDPFQPFLGASPVSEWEEAAFRQWGATLEAILPGPQPWCRVCWAGVDDWRWTRYAGGFSGIWCRCHGDTCGALIWDSALHARIEAFCDNEPRMPGTRIWFVQPNGDELQPCAAYLCAAVESGRRSLPINRLFRESAPYVMMAVSLATAGVLWLL